MDIAEPSEIPNLPLPEKFNALPAEHWTVQGQSMCLDAKEYENLTRNLADLLRWAEQARDRLDIYRSKAHGR